MWTSISAQTFVVPLDVDVLVLAGILSVTHVHLPNAVSYARCKRWSPHLKQQDNELETSYFKRVHHPIHCFGKLHGEEENITVYIGGISANTQTILARNRRSVSRRDFIFKEIVHLSRSEDETILTRTWPNLSTQSSDNQRPRTSSPTSLGAGASSSYLLLTSIAHRKDTINIVEGYNSNTVSGEGSKLMLLHDQHKTLADELLLIVDDTKEAFNLDERRKFSLLTTRVFFDHGKTAQVSWLKNNSALICRSVNKKGQ